MHFNGKFVVSDILVHVQVVEIFREVSEPTVEGKSTVDYACTCTDIHADIVVVAHEFILVQPVVELHTHDEVGALTEVSQIQLLLFILDFLDFGVVLLIC